MNCMYYDQKEIVKLLNEFRLKLPSFGVGIGTGASVFPNTSGSSISEMFHMDVILALLMET